MLTFINAHVFDGVRTLPGRRTVRLNGNLIASCDEGAPAEGGEVVDLAGMTLMPGLITSHLHADFYKFNLQDGLAGAQLGKELPPQVLMAVGIRTCRVLLESGFTGYVGASCSNHIDAQLKIAIAEGIVPGPRIRACSHHLGTTGDLNASKKWWQEYVSPGTDLFIDGPDAMRKQVREEIRHGAEIIKIFASRGHGFPALTARNMARDEIAAVCNAAHQRGAKVRAHVSEKDMILECIELGVDVIDHGDGVDEEVIDAMARAGSFWAPSQGYTKVLLDLGWGDELMRSQYGNVMTLLPLAQKAGVRIVLGDDYSGVFRDILPDDPLDHQVGSYGREFSFYNELAGISAADVLSWGTRNPGELLVDGGARAGLIEPGALADLIVVDGDPMKDLGLLARPKEVLKAVVRDGAMVIDRLPAAARRSLAPGVAA